MAVSSQYIPGQCNIGAAGIRRRQRIGWFGLLVTGVLWAAFTAFGVASAWFLLFLPASLSAVGFLQASLGFCADFGLRGVMGFGAEWRGTESVAQAEFRAQDRKKALQISAASVLTGLVVAVAAFFIH